MNNNNNSSHCFHLSTLETVTSKSSQNALMLLYCCISLLSLVGNVIVIVVQLFGRDSTSQGIRKYLINLAVTDIIIGVLSVPFTYTNIVLRQWIFPHWLCPIAQIVQLLCVFITSISLTVIGIERYFATLYPLSRQLRWLQSHTNLIIILIWIIGLLYSYFPLRHTATKPFELNSDNNNNNTFYQCTYDNELSVDKRRIYFALNFMVTYAIPSIIMTAVYMAIMRKVRNSEKLINFTSDDEGAMGRTLNGYVGSQSSTRKNESSIKTRMSKIKRQNTTQSFILRSTRQIQNRAKTIKILFVVIILYDICWFPIKMYQFLLGFDLVSYCTEFQFYLLIYIYIGAHWLAMAHSFVNPIVYSFMSSGFRTDFRKIRKSIRSRCKMKPELALDLAKYNNNNNNYNVNHATQL